MKYSKYNLMVTKNSVQYYIFNTLNGNCIEVSSEVAAYVKNGVINSLCEEDANLLIKSGIIIEDYIDENRIISYFHDKDKFSLNYFSSYLSSNYLSKRTKSLSKLFNPSVAYVISAPHLSCLSALES